MKMFHFSPAAPSPGSQEGQGLLASVRMSTWHISAPSQGAGAATQTPHGQSASHPRQPADKPLLRLCQEPVLTSQHNELLFKHFSLMV